MIVGWKKLPAIVSEGSSLEIRKMQNQSNSLEGKKILYQLVWKQYGIDLTLEENPISIMEKGKPYLCNHPDIHFNISHSNDLVACVVADAPVGIDVQYCEAKNIQVLAKRAFSPEEWKDFEESDFCDEFFFRYWTKKESYLKYTGEGIRSDLRKMEYEGAKFWELELCPGYMGMVCMPMECEEEVRVVNVIQGE